MVSSIFLIFLKHWIFHYYTFRKKYFFKKSLLYVLEKEFKKDIFRYKNLSKDEKQKLVQYRKKKKTI